MKQRQENNNFSDKITVRAPGRICILGEHQDYLGLEVISGAINLGVTLEAEKNPIGREFVIQLHQTGKTQIIDPSSEIKKPGYRDYLSSGVKVMKEYGLQFNQSWKIDVTGDLLIGKGVSSSSALCVGWITLLCAIADNPIDLSPQKIAKLAYQTEVEEFNEPGGMQDHIASASGGLLHMDFQGKPGDFPVITSLNPVPEGFLLVDSGETKETLGMIRRIRESVENQCKTIWNDEFSELNLKNILEIPASTSQIDPYIELRGTLKNRNIVREAVQNWSKTTESSGYMLSQFIREHHKILAGEINSSSPGIENLIAMAESAGASAGKVVGSGGGGCLLIYAPDNSVHIMNILRKSGVKVVQIKIHEGVSCT